MKRLLKSTSDQVMVEHLLRSSANHSLLVADVPIARSGTDPALVDGIAGRLVSRVGGDAQAICLIVVASMHGVHGENQ